MSMIERMRPRPNLRVLVTAGASGIGAAIAEAFLEADAKVMICDIDEAALAAFAARHPRVEALRADVSDAAEVDALFDAASDRLGGLDVLVNNAGIAGPTGAIDAVPLDEIRRTLDIDLMGPFLVLRRAAPLLRRSEAGAIVNISSVAGRLGYALRTPYSAAKWGIVGLTASLAKEMGPDGIRVNAILPGVVRGARIEGVIRERAAASGRSYEDMEAQYLANISLRRMVEPEDVAGLALFLCSPAGANISGQAISVCGNVETI
ncbi:SDR family oxidoreductase [Aurantimonas sp. MSK8Z-1]|uniref:SDR family oxidoreductase n=1 Tax=Mangrovibrevibacter kandeliae TaxID=2968473 RepID=UPI0021186D5E|nr:SDR family oxidoreductase [Aurantimonas sp. MSK8Z-1]MCW4113428.1 SDR family oxidoreductase [Aurantimonas sp. MSK8Z-1]